MTHPAEKDAQRDLEDWLTDNRWPNAYDLSCALADAGFARVTPPGTGAAHMPPEPPPEDYEKF